MRNSYRQILGAARELYSQGGIENVSMRKVSAIVGVTPMAIYRHFRNRDDLLAAVAAQAFQEWERRVEGIHARDHRIWIKKLFREYLDFALFDTRNFQAAFLLSTRDTRRFPDDFVAGKSRAGQIIMGRLEEWARAKSLRAGYELWELFMMMWAAAQGLVMLYQGNRFSCDAEEFTRLYLRSMETLLTGFEGGSRR